MVIPVYNGGAYLSDAVGSILAQTLQDFELILVDDGSTDGGPDSLECLADPRVRVLTQDNLGPAAACNTALSVARGAYVAFLDQDDLWAPAKLDCHLQAFKANPDVDLTFTWYAYVDERAEALGFQPRRWHGRVNFEQLLVDNVIGPSSTVSIRRSAIDRSGGFDPNLHMSYDVDLNLRVLRGGPGAALAIPEVMAFYRRHTGQMSREWRALQDDWQRVLAKFRALEPDTVRRVERRANTIMCHYFACVAYERREFNAGARLLVSGLWRDPLGVALSRRHWRVLLACLAGDLLPPYIHRRLELLAGLKPFAAHQN